MQILKLRLKEKIQDIYPIQEDKMSTVEIKKLYSIFNDEYFDGILPKNLKIYTNKLAQNTLGKASVNFVRGDMSIMIADHILNSYTITTEVLLHEMIHIWQFTKDIQEGSRKYSSPSFADYLLKNNDKGHNKYFKEWMDKLNRYGYEITVTQDTFLEVEMDKDLYVIVIEAADSYAVFWDVKPIKEDLIIEQFKDMFYPEITSYQYFTTRDVNVFSFRRLTKSGIKKRSVNVFFNKNFVNKFLEHTGKVINRVEYNVGENSELINAVKGVLLPFHKHAIKMNFDKDRYSYLVQVMFNVNKKYNKVETIYQEVPEEIIQLIKDDWKKVKVSDIKRASFGSNFTLRDLVDLLKNNNLRKIDFIKNDILYYLNKNGLYERFNDKEIYEGLKDYMLSNMKKLQKKLRKDDLSMEDMNTTIEHLFTKVIDVKKIIKEGRP